MIYPPAVQRPGPGWKQGYPGLAVNARRGVICHSMVGSLGAAFDRLYGPDTASWHFSIAQDGTVYQHYDTMAVCWHAGSPKWNGLLIGIEHEGGPPGNESEPLTAPQLATSVELVRWLAVECGFRLSRTPPDKALWEHHETGYPTACPSGRIPWAEYTEEPMTPEERQQFDTVVGKLYDLQRQITDLKTLVGLVVPELADEQNATVKQQLAYIAKAAG